MNRIATTTLAAAALVLGGMGTAAAAPMSTGGHGGPTESVAVQAGGFYGYAKGGLYGYAKGLRTGVSLTSAPNVVVPQRVTALPFFGGMQVS